jgi:hypothetical protein
MANATGSGTFANERRLLIAAALPGRFARPAPEE